MALVSTPKANVTPVADREGLQAQINEQVAVLYATEGTPVWDKEVAALNYRLLVNYYAALFHELPN